MTLIDLGFPEDIERERGHLAGWLPATLFLDTDGFYRGTGYEDGEKFHVATKSRLMRMSRTGLRGRSAQGTLASSGQRN